LSLGPVSIEAAVVDPDEDPDADPDAPGSTA